MQSLFNGFKSFNDELMSFIRESTVNEIKIALIINVVLTILISFYADSAYEIIKSLGLTWVIILTICTILLRTTTRKAVKERHEKMYKWITSLYDNHLAKVSLKTSVLYVVGLLAVVVMIFSKVTLVEVILLVILNNGLLIGICLFLKKSLGGKYVKFFME